MKARFFLALAMALAVPRLGADGGRTLLRNPSFEEDGAWCVEGEGGLTATDTYGPIPDGRRLMHFRQRAWQDTGVELQSGQEWEISFQAASYGTTRMEVEWRASKGDGTPGRLLGCSTIHFPKGQLWGHRKDVPPDKRFMNKYIARFSAPDNAAGTLVVAFVAREGYAGIDAVELRCAMPSVMRRAGAPGDAAMSLFGFGQWLGGNDFGLLWQGSSPRALALRQGDHSLVKEWTGGEFWRIVFDDKEHFSNLEAGQPEISLWKEGRRLKWEHEGLLLHVTVRPRSGYALEFGFELRNGTPRTVQSIHLPAGWTEAIRTQGQWIVPAWIGAGVSMETLQPTTVLYPGQLHSQWFGFQDRTRFSWMVHTEDAIPCTKFLSLEKVPEGRNRFTWWHDLYLAPGKTYACPYPTVLTAFPSGDWNDMAKHYRKWARTAPWFLPIGRKLSLRPQLARLKDGWSWLRGMPPVKEVGGRKCDTTYAQALECMGQFRSRLRLDPMFWYTGWYGPFDSMYPQFFPIAPELGGAFGDFASEVRRGGHFVTLHLNGAEFNEGARNFRLEKMARWHGKFYRNTYGDEHANYVVSYPCVQPDMLEYTRLLAGTSGLNIHYDVMGHVYAHDDNPEAGYSPDTIGRCNWNVAKNNAWRALREAAPCAYFQTEACAECAIPYVDAHSGGSTVWVLANGRRPLPLWQLVYGDTGLYLPLYDGAGQYNCARGFTLNPLFAIIAQFPQNLWRSLEPYWLFIVRRQKISGAQAGKELLRYEDDGEFRRSFWSDAVVLAMDSSHAPCQAVMRWKGAELTARDFQVSPEFAKRGAGSVLIRNERGLAADAVSEVTERGSLLWRAPDGRLSVAAFDGILTVFNGTSDEIDGQCQVGLPAFVSASRVRQWDFVQGKWTGERLVHVQDGLASLPLHLPSGCLVELMAE
ncbi:MAG: hypothetical protein IJJ33_19260 [Victivallales bacterium]|nr:hypothetical protein [Victivallales bacterium]